MNEMLTNTGISAIGGADGPTSIFIAGKLSVGAMIVAAVLGLFICFFGLKLMKLLTIVIGFIIGSVVGLGIAVGTGVEGVTFAIITLACGIVLALLTYFLYKIGVFFIAFCGTGGVLAMLVDTSSVVLLIVVFVVAIIAGILAVIYIEPIIIVITAISGGISAGVMLMDILGTAELALTLPSWIGYVLGVVLAILGMIVQFALHSKKIKAREETKAESIKESDSMEMEVEKAKNILDEGTDDDADLDEEEIIMLDDEEER